MPIVRRRARAAALVARALLATAPLSACSHAPAEPQLDVWLRTAEGSHWLALGDTVRTTARASVWGGEGFTDVEPPRLTWTTASSSVATVDAAGLVTARGVGRTTLEVSGGTDAHSIPVTVLPAFAPRALALGSLPASGGGPAEPGWGCAVGAGGGLHCWGALGGVVRALPEPVPGGESLVSVAAGARHACGLDAAGAAYCWGANADGALGDGTTAPSDRPVAVAGGLRFTALGAGRDFSCGLAADGAVHCWGAGAAGQLGTGAAAASATPVRVADDARFVALAVGDERACGLAADGTARCWGTARWGEFGDGRETVAPAPVTAAGGQPFVALSLGARHGCGLTADGTLLCWGRSTDGALGHGPGVGRPFVLPAPVQGDRRYASVVARQSATCAVDRDGGLWCWGDNRDGQLGVGSRHGDVRAPTRVALPWPVAEVALGGAFGCARAADGRAACWGGGGSDRTRVDVFPGVSLANPAALEECEHEERQYAPQCRPRPLPMLWNPTGVPLP